MRWCTCSVLFCRRTEKYPNFALAVLDQAGGYPGLRMFAQFAVRALYGWRCCPHWSSHNQDYQHRYSCFYYKYLFIFLVACVYGSLWSTPVYRSIYCGAPVAPTLLYVFSDVPWSINVCIAASYCRVICSLSQVPLCCSSASICDDTSRSLYLADPTGTDTLARRA